MNARFLFRRHGSLKMMLPAVVVLLSIAAATASAADRYVAQPRALPRMKPGTVVGREAPRGWSHLIIKSQPRLAQHEAEKLHSMAARLTRMLFTAFVANVMQERSADGRRFRLESVAVGLGTPIDGKDVIVSSKTLDEQNAELDLIASFVLSQSEKELAKVVEIGRSATMSLFDSPAILLREEKHEAVVLRHAVLVDPDDGQLETLVWVLNISADRYLPASQRLRRLKPNLVFDCYLHVDSDEVIAGIPNSTAFAMFSLPGGDKLDKPRSLGNITARRRMTPRDLERIEVQLRRALRSVGR